MKLALEPAELPDQGWLDRHLGGNRPKAPRTGRARVEQPRGGVLRDYPATDTSWIQVVPARGWLSWLGVDESARGGSRALQPGVEDRSRAIPQPGHRPHDGLDKVGSENVDRSLAKISQLIRIAHQRLLEPDRQVLVKGGCGGEAAEPGRPNASRSVRLDQWEKIPRCPVSHRHQKPHLIAARDRDASVERADDRPRSRAGWTRHVSNIRNL